MHCEFLEQAYLSIEAEADRLTDRNRKLLQEELELLEVVFACYRNPAMSHLLGLHPGRRRSRFPCW